MEKDIQIEKYNFSNIKHKAYIPPERKIPCVGGWRWAMPLTPEFCVGGTNMLKCENLPYPTPNPRRQT